MSSFSRLVHGHIKGSTWSLSPTEQESSAERPRSAGWLVMVIAGLNLEFEPNGTGEFG